MRNKDTRCPKGLPEMLITTDGLAAGKAEELATHFGHSRTSLYSCLMLNSSCATSFSVILPETCTFFSKIIACCDILEQRINCTLQIKDSIYTYIPFGAVSFPQELDTSSLDDKAPYRTNRR
jgi:hypothetical protein